VKRLAALALVVLAGGCGGAGDEPEPPRPVVILSGKDDHGLVAQAAVALAAEPDGAPVAKVADGTLVSVVAERGEWLRVRTLEGGEAEGWVNDYYLRGTAHLVPERAGCRVPARPSLFRPAQASYAASAQVELLEVTVAGDGTWVRVRDLAGGRDAWVARPRVAELPDRRPPARGC
jgi:SH3-like domain-containing protein